MSLGGLAKVGIRLTFRTPTLSGEATVSTRGGLGGLALIEVVIAIVLAGMLCAVLAAAIIN